MRLHLPATKLILRDLELGPATLHELLDVTGLSLSTIKAYVRELRENRLIHICGYERLRNGMRPVFAIGGKSNASRPRPYTKTELMRRYRGRVRLQRLSGRPCEMPTM